MKWRNSWLGSPKRNMPGWVYILTGDNGLYKIGSTKRIEKRVWEISHYSGIKCAIYFFSRTENMNKLEKRLHRIFAAKRVFGEWFDLSSIDLLSVIEIINGDSNG